MQNVIGKIHSSLKTILWRRHARIEAENDNISESCLEDALRGGFRIVEFYPDDPRGVSALVLTLVDGNPVHVVLAPMKDLMLLNNSICTRTRQMGRDIYKEEKEISYKCRCGGELKLDFMNEHTRGVLIKDVPILVCTKCGEEWYPPGVPRMIEGIREAVSRTGQVKLFENLKIISEV